MGTKASGVFEMSSMRLDGTWQAYDLTGGNMFILQCRQDRDINVSNHSKGMGYFTIKAGQSLPLSSFWIDTGTQMDIPETIYVRGTAGDDMETLKQKMT